MFVEFLPYFIAMLVGLWGLVLVGGSVWLLRRANRGIEGSFGVSPVRVLSVVGVVGLFAWLLINYFYDVLLVVGGILAVAALIAGFAGIARFNSWLMTKFSWSSQGGMILGAIECWLLIALIASFFDWFVGLAMAVFVVVIVTVLGVFYGLHRLLKRVLPFPVGQFYAGLIALVVYGTWVWVAWQQALFFTASLIGLGVGVWLLTRLHKYIKARSDINMGNVWFGLVLVGMYGALLYVFPVGTLGISAIVIAVIVIGAVLRQAARGLQAFRRWLLARYNINLGRILAATLGWTLFVGAAGGALVGLGIFLYHYWLATLLAVGFGLGITGVGYGFYRLNRWMAPALKARYGRTLAEILGLLLVIAIVIGAAGAMIYTIILDWEEFSQGLGVLATFIGVLIAIGLLVAALIGAHEWTTRRYQLPLWVIVARGALIPLTIGAVWMVVVYGNYAAMLREGTVVEGEVLALEETAGVYRIEYTYDPNKGDPPDFRTQWQAVPEDFYKARERGQTLPTYFLNRDPDVSSITVITDALESAMLAVVLILGTPLWGLGVFIHWRRTRRPAQPPATVTETASPSPA